MDKITQQEAKDITLEVWTYLKAHPQLNCKRDVPPATFNKIANHKNWCSLCELFYEVDNEDTDLEVVVCTRCPLRIESGATCSDDEDLAERSDNPYVRWSNVTSDKAKKKYAGEIIDIVSKWIPKD